MTDKETRNIGTDRNKMKKLIKYQMQCCKYVFIEWPVTFLSECSKDD